MKREIVIVGGGPAGLAAAIESAKAGAQVLLIDQNDCPGGQLFKQIHKFFGSKEHRAGIRGIDIGKTLLQECHDAGVEVWLSSTAIGIYERNMVAVVRETVQEQKLATVQADCILLATGGMENALNFKGLDIAWRYGRRLRSDDDKRKQNTAGSKGSDDRLR